MQISELIKKVHSIEIKTRRLVDEIFSGEYHSIFKGQGLEVAEVREYHVEDDIRLIDWNVTARLGVPYVKTFEETREIMVLFVVDFSQSGFFGTKAHFKNELAAIVCSILAFSAIKNNDHVGLLLITDQVELFLKPKRGKTHVLCLISEVLNFKPQSMGTNLSKAFEFLINALKRKSIIFCFSDFFADGYQNSLRILQRKHDVIGVRMSDPLESNMPDVGLMNIEDLENGQTVLVDTSDPSWRALYQNRLESERARVKREFASLGLDFIELVTNQDYVEPLRRFFEVRAKRLRR